MKAQQTQQPQIQAKTLPINKGQYKNLEKQRDKVVRKQRQINNLQSRQVFEANILIKKAKKVIQENNWPDDTQFDANTLSFYQKQNGVIEQHPMTPPVPQGKNEKDDNLKDHLN